MNRDLLNSKDFWGGAMLIATGLTAVFIARDYPFGTTLRMGPGYFPIVLGGIIGLFGLLLVAKSLRIHDPIAGGWSPRALIVLPFALGLFGLLMDHAGFVPALIVLVFASAAASSAFKLMEVAALTLLLTVLSVAVFVWGLGLPYKLLAGF